MKKKTKLEQLLDEQTALQLKISAEKQAVYSRAKKLNQFEFAIVYSVEENNTEWKTPILLYHATGGVICLNSYFDFSNPTTFPEILAECERWNTGEKKLKIKKVSKEEALKWM